MTDMAVKMIQDNEAADVTRTEEAYRERFIQNYKMTMIAENKHNLGTDILGNDAIR